MMTPLRSSNRHKKLLGKEKVISTCFEGIVNLCEHTMGQIR
jgi:hypothetical protein